MNSQSYEWHWIVEPSELRALESEWTSLFETMASGTHIFQAFSWCLNWVESFVESFETGWKISVLTCRQEGRLVLICPLAVKSNGPIKIGYWLGEPLTQYGDVLIASDVERGELIDEMWSQVRRCQHFDLVLFNYVRDDSHLSDTLSKIASFISEQGAVSLKLSDYADWTELEKWHLGHVSRNTRKARRRSLKNLEEMGELECKRLSEKEAVDNAIEEIWAEKAAWLEEKGLRSSTFADPFVKHYLQALMASKATDIEAVLFCLLVDGKPIAHEIGFLSQGRYAQHIASFSLGHSKGAPGNYLTEYSLKTFQSQGVDWFDQMAPAYESKLRWGTQINQVRVFALPVSLRGAVYTSFYLKFAKPVLKAILDNLPLPLKRFAKQVQDRLSSR